MIYPKMVREYGRVSDFSTGEPFSDLETEITMGTLVLRFRVAASAPPLAEKMNLRPDRRLHERKGPCSIGDLGRPWRPPGG